MSVIFNTVPMKFSIDIKRHLLNINCLLNLVGIAPWLLTIYSNYSEYFILH